MSPANDSNSQDRISRRQSPTLRPIGFLIALLFTSTAAISSANEVLLTGWHDFSSGYQLYRFAGSPKPAVGQLNGVTGSLWGGDGSRQGWGSTDGTYGPSVAVGSSATNGAMSIRVDKDTIRFSVDNNTPGNLALGRVLFDFASVNGNSPQNLQLYYDNGDLDDPDNTLLMSWTSILNGLANVSDYEDVEVILDGLNDATLGPGQSATFRFEVDTANVNNQALGIDNVAVMGAATEFRVLTYNIHGGYGPDGEGDPVSNLTAFRENFMNNEDVLCLQEVDLGDTWAAVQSVFPDYPYTYQTVNNTTLYYPFFFSSTSVAIISKHPFTTTHSEVIQIDPQGDKWERHAQHVTIDVGGETVDIFNFHNTYNFFENDFESEKEGLTKFRDYVLTRLGVSSLANGGRLLMLGDFNVLQADVIAILPTPARRSNGLDHISSVPLHTGAGAYATAVADISDHNAVWASLDLAPPNPNPMTWASAPAEAGTTAITMTAATASDPTGVEYFFTNTSIVNGSHDSGWQASPTYTDTSLTPATVYDYTVKARDKSLNANETTPTATTPATTDDGDPLPNDWELFYFSTLDATSGGPEEDWDNDGLIDYDEWIAGTDPTDPSSHFHMWVEAGESGEAIIRWTAVPGKTYHIISSATLDSDWEEVASDLPAVVPESTFTVPTTSPRMFYRVGVSL